MIEKKTLGQLVDELTILNLRCWFAQEDLMDEELSDSDRLDAALDAQHYNAKRAEVIQAIDKKFGEENSVESKSYG